MLSPRPGALALLAVVVLLSCNGSGARPLLPRSQTWAELRTIRRAVTVQPPEEGGARSSPAGAPRRRRGRQGRGGGPRLAAARRGRDAARARGSPICTLRAGAVEIASGRVFIDTPARLTTEIVTPGGALHLAHVRASIDVERRRHRGLRPLRRGARGGQRSRRRGRAAHPHRSRAGRRAPPWRPVLSWEDWTGGLATTDRAAEPAPYGVGTVGAQAPGRPGIAAVLPLRSSASTCACAWTATSP